MSKIEIVSDSRGEKIFYTGPLREAGPLPAFFYFALSGEESLSLHPFNSPAVHLKDLPLRIFSLTIPGHGDAFNRFDALYYWAEQMEKGHLLLEDFFQRANDAINWLIENHFVDPERIAVGGLSRGGFVATHIAAMHPKIKYVLGFAPLTELLALHEFSHAKGKLRERAEKLNLTNFASSLTHLSHLLYYIGNRDKRVETDACYQFIHSLAEEAHVQRARHCKIEMKITHSIGHKGHGTAPSIFQEGALWIKNQLIGSD